MLWLKMDGAHWGWGATAQRCQGVIARNDVLGAARANPGLYGRARIWIDVGRDDPFRSADTELSRRLPQARFHLRAGGHDISYLNAHMTQILGFYADALARCR